MLSYGEDGNLGYHIVFSLIAYVFLLAVLFKLVSLYVLLKTDKSKKSEIKEQLALFFSEMFGEALMSSVMGIGLFLLVIIPMKLIDIFVFDIFGVIYGFFDKVFFVVSLLMASVMTVFAYRIFFFTLKNENKLRQFIELQEFADLTQVELPKDSQDKSKGDKNQKKPTTKPIKTDPKARITKTEISSIENHLRTKFFGQAIKLKAREEAKESAEVLLGGEFIGIIFKDIDEETSYDFHMSILEVDIE